jgi:NADPH:quinone reductase-like Zn-dependent oxidoreductase
VDYPVGEVGSRDVSVDMMMCAINPADINQIQGMMLITTIIQVDIDLYYNLVLLWHMIVHY